MTKRKDNPQVAGRPSKYDPAFCDQMIAFCRQGYSLTAFAGSIGVSRETISEWDRVHPEFSVATKIAKAAAALKWEERAGKVGERGGGPGTAQMIVFALKNMAAADFRDKIENTHSGPDGGPIEVRRIERVIVDPADPDA